MRRARHDVFAQRTTAAYAVVWDLEWHLITSRRLEPGCDLYGALLALLEQIQAEGWRPECEPEYGFTFVCRGLERRLVMVTARDPTNVGSQSFNPFRK